MITVPYHGEVAQGSSAIMHQGKRPAATEAARDVAILGFRASISGPAELLDGLEVMRPPTPAWAASAADDISTVFEVRPDTPRPGRYRITRDGVPVYSPEHRAELLSYLDRAINAAAVEHLGRSYLLFHPAQRHTPTAESSCPPLPEAARPPSLPGCWQLVSNTSATRLPSSSPPPAV